MNTSSDKPSQSTVLIVEDEWIVARDMQQTLQADGHIVPPPATTAAEALEAAKIWSPDLVLMDIVLDERRDGVDLVRRMRDQRPLGVVFVSAHADEGTINRVRDTQAHGFVVKPFTPTQLRATVRIALDNVHAMQRPQQTTPVANLALQRIAQVLLEAGIGVGSVPSEFDTPRVPALSQLTNREWEVLRELLALHRVPRIAKKLFISQHTVRNHLKSIYAKLGVHSQDELLDLLKPSRGNQEATARSA
jgi:DNA-binding NarL/FixJ family response regulator